MRTVILCLCLTAVALPAFGQIKNPTLIAFDTCPDHATDDGHEVDIIRVSDGLVLAVVPGGDPDFDSNGEVVISVNVQPITISETERYIFVVRACVGTLCSKDSLPTEEWQRVPGTPSGATAR